MTHPAYTWIPYPCTGTPNFESVARDSLQANMENNMDEETRLLAIEDWSAFNPNTMPGSLILDATVKAAKLEAVNSPFDGYVPTYNAATGAVSWQDMSGVVGSDTYQVKWTISTGSAFLEDFIATQSEAEAGTVDDKLMTPERVADAVNALLPAGMIAPFAQGAAPSGWLVCDGREVDRTVENRLFLTISTLYGIGDGSSTFNLPDYRGQFLRGFDDTTEVAAADVDPDKATRSDRGDGATGDKVGTGQSSANLTHDHSVNPPNTGTDYESAHVHSQSGASVVTVSTGGATTTGVSNDVANNTGSGGGHSHSVNIPAFASAESGNDESRPTNINVLYCIKR